MPALCFCTPEKWVAIFDLWIKAGVLIEKITGQVWFGEFRKTTKLSVILLLLGKYAVKHIYRSGGMGDVVNECVVPLLHHLQLGGLPARLPLCYSPQEQEAPILCEVQQGCLYCNFFTR